MSLRNIFIALAALAIAVGACSTASAPDPVIGVLLPLSGPHAEVGEELRRGLELELERIRSSQGGVALQVEVLDTEGRPARAEAQAEELVDRDVVAIVGGVTGDDAEVIERVAAKNETVFVSLSPSGSVEGRLSFRLVPAEDDVAVALASYAARSLGRGEVSVLSAAASADGVDEALRSGSSRAVARSWPPSSTVRLPAIWTKSSAAPSTDGPGPSSCPGRQSRWRRSSVASPNGDTAGRC